MVFFSFLVRNRKGTLSSVITQTTGFSGKKVKKLIDEGLVCVNGIKALKRNYLVSLKDSVEFSVSDYIFQKISEVEILYEDESFLIINKPPFVNTNIDKPDVEGFLKKKYGAVFAVHRLDKQTSGAVIFAKSRKVFSVMVDIFKKRRVKKVYRAVVSGGFSIKKTLSYKLDGQEAISVVKPVNIYENATVLEIEIKTGRKHQIRRHLSMLGFPVAGEFLYWKKAFPFLLRFAPRIMLHSEYLSFKSPVTGKEIEVEAPVFKDFENFVNVLKGGRGTLPLKEYT